MSQPDPPSPPPRKTLGPAFWAALLFGAACIFLGLVVGIWGSRLFPPDPARAPPPAGRAASGLNR